MENAAPPRRERRGFRSVKSDERRRKRNAMRILNHIKFLLQYRRERMGYWTIADRQAHDIIQSALMEVWKELV